MDSRISFNLPVQVQTILDILSENKRQGYIVGGCVRDTVMGVTPNDWDFATDAHTDEIIRVFSEKGFRVIPTGVKHGTVTVLIKSTGYEITTFRTDGEYSDYRHPDSVDFVKNIEQDLSRRDFTINAMAYNPKDGLIDPFNGISDLMHNDFLRTVGDPERRISEDPLRMMRAVRFSVRFSKKFSPELEKAVSKRAYLIEKISRERVNDEFVKILLCQYGADGVRLLSDTGLMAYICPAFIRLKGLRQIDRYHGGEDVYTHTLRVIDYTYPKKTIRLAAFLHDIGKYDTLSYDGMRTRFIGHEKISAEKAREFMNSMRFSGKDICDVANLIENHMLLKDYDTSKSENDKKTYLRKVIVKVGCENMSDFVQLCFADEKATPSCNMQKYEKYEEIIGLFEQIRNEKVFSAAELEIDGNDILALGVRKGPMIGEILEYLLEMVLKDPSINSRLELIKLAEQYIKAAETGGK